MFHPTLYEKKDRETETERRVDAKINEPNTLQITNKDSKLTHNAGIKSVTQRRHTFLCHMEIRHRFEF